MLRRSRAAHSAAANIAEGCAKKGKTEFSRYLNISLGSLSELSYTLLSWLRNWGFCRMRIGPASTNLHQKARAGMTWLLYKSLLPKKSVPESPLTS